MVNVLIHGQERRKKNKVIGVYYWGDTVDLVDEAEADNPLIKVVKVNFYSYLKGDTVEGYIKKKSIGKVNGVTNYRPFRWRDTGDYLLESTFLDVQQGDSTIIRTPDRKLIIIDGGEGKFLSRYLASKFPGTSDDNPLIIDALFITHGDADHFSGLTELENASTHRLSRKRIFTKINRYYHNGLVKTPKKKLNEQGNLQNRIEKEKLGAYTKIGSKFYATSLHNDPRTADDPNQPFTEWNQALGSLMSRQGVIKRLEFGDNTSLSDLENRIKFQVLGPIVKDHNGTPVLEFLKGDSGISAGHTINGHSIMLRMIHGNVRFLLGGGLNHHSQDNILKAIKSNNDAHIRAEIFKVPHHGSHDFSMEFIKTVNPVVSIVSSGDENSVKEYVHPRANLMAALGFCSRGSMPLVFSTELAAFFAYRGFVIPERHEKKNGKLKNIAKSKIRGGIHAFQRLIFGVVRVRTDGNRVLVAVESANDGIKEAYAFYVDEEGVITPDKVVIY